MTLGTRSDAVHGYQRFSLVCLKVEHGDGGAFFGHADYFRPPDPKRSARHDGNFPDQSFHDFTCLLEGSAGRFSGVRAPAASECLDWPSRLHR